MQQAMRVYASRLDGMTKPRIKGPFGWRWRWGHREARLVASIAPWVAICWMMCGLLSLPGAVHGQTAYQLRGTVRDTLGAGLPDVEVYIHRAGKQQRRAITDASGTYQLDLDWAKHDTLHLRVQALGYVPVDTALRVNGGIKEATCDVVLRSASIAIGDIRVVSQHAEQSATVERLSARELVVLPTASGGVEALLKTLPGVSARNELSSQYSVRGGSFDENLVYVDGVELHRPMLVRSGEQEGLSAINPDMVGSLDFSAGAFPARHGDRMSSVLNVHYRRPREYGARVHLGLLESRGSLEGYLSQAGVSGMLGVRYKNTRMLLNTTDVKGDYRPQYMDVQGKAHWSVGSGVELRLLGGAMRNAYHFQPSNKRTVFGAGSSSLLTMNIYYEGQERDEYLSGFGMLGARWEPVRGTWVEGGLSTSVVSESEQFDILGEYWLSDIQDPSAAPRFNDSVANVGIGGSLSHARNYFRTRIHACHARGMWSRDAWQVEGGVEVSQRILSHNLREWHLQDSAGYSLPHGALAFDDANLISDSKKLTLYRHGAYVQAKWKGTVGSMDIEAEGGGRISARERLEALRVSPRGSVSVMPHGAQGLTLYLASGLYYQYPFYREMRDRRGGLHPGLRPQRAWHVLGGVRWHFKAWGEDFRLQGEVYSKRIAHMIPYTVDNLSLQYEAHNGAEGEQLGVDVKLHGELVRGVESWLSVSVLRARMRFRDPFGEPNGGTAPTGWIAMPTDQRFALALFLQDHIPGAPFIRVHVSGHYASGVPVGHPLAPYTQQHRLPPYKRVDIGFSYIMKDAAYSARWLAKIGWLRELTAMVEVYNLLNFSNTASYLWVSVPTPDGQRGQLAVPNYLTARSINMRIALGF